MEQRRWLVFLGVTGLVYILFWIFVFAPYQKSLEEHRAKHPEQYARTRVTTSTLTATTATVPTVRPDVETSPTTIAEQPTSTTPVAEATELVVRTEMFRVTLTSRGGRPVSWQYFDRIPGRNGVETVEIIPQHPDGPADRELPLEVHLIESNRIPYYTAFNKTVFEHEVAPLDDGSTRVVFTSPAFRKIRLVKTYVFRPSGYLTHLQIALRNEDPKSSCQVVEEYDIRQQRGLKRGLGISWGPGVRQFRPSEKPNVRYINTIYGTPNRVGHAKPTKPPDKEDPEKNIKRYRGRISWGGVTDTFFLAAILPKQFEMTMAESLVTPDAARLQNDRRLQAPPFTIILYNDPFAVGAESEVVYDFELFVGPKRPPVLKQVAKATDTRIDRALFYLSWFGWMRQLKIGLMKALSWLHSLLGSYGVAIVLLTILIRLLTHPIAHKGMKMQAKTMAEMRKVKPMLDEINRKYKSDPAKRNQEMMALYKEHGISPLAPLRGCLPMLIQIPIFFALYSLLSQSIDLRGASFLWIDDLSGPDKLVDLTAHGMAFQIPLLGWRVTSVNLLPILMGISQFLMSKLTPTPTQDASQKQMMLIFTIMFPVMLYNFPSGLFIYWLINNVWQSVHQLIANRIIRKEPTGQAAAAKA